MFTRVQQHNKEQSVWRMRLWRCNKNKKNGVIKCLWLQMHKLCHNKIWNHKRIFLIFFLLCCCFSERGSIKGNFSVIVVVIIKHSFFWEKENFTLWGKGHKFHFRWGRHDLYFVSRDEKNENLPFRIGKQSAMRIIMKALNYFFLWFWCLKITPAYSLLRIYKSVAIF